MGRLHGKIAVVTGASGVLCSHMAATLLEQGARVALLARTREKLERTVEALAERGLKNTLVVAADVLDADALQEARRRVTAAWGPPDILLNGAGGNRPGATTDLEQAAPGNGLQGSFFDLDPAAFASVMDLNLRGTLLPSQVFGRAMAERGSGVIINVSSMSAERPLTRVPGYSAAKAAVDNLTRWLAVHLARRGVRVNAIAPGFLLSEQNRFLLFEEDGKTLTARGRKILANTPMGRFGEPEELKDAVVFLASEQSRFVTGIVLPVDGGFSAYAGV